MLRIAIGVTFIDAEGEAFLAARLGEGCSSLRRGAL